MTDRTVRRHRVLRTKPEKVYRAFLDADAISKWFDDPNLPGLLEVTVALKPVICGTEVSITQAGIP